MIILLSIKYVNEMNVNKLTFWCQVYAEHIVFCYHIALLFRINVNNQIAVVNCQYSIKQNQDKQQGR